MARSDGSLEVRVVPPPAHPDRKRSLDPPKGTFRHFRRGQGFQPRLDEANIVIVGSRGAAENDDDDKEALGLGPSSSRRKKPKKLKAYDEALRKFRYGDALDEAFGTRDPVVVVSVLRELDRRGATRSAIDHRDEDRLEPLLAFLAAHLANPRYAPTLLDVAQATLHLYAGALGRLPDVDDLFAKLRAQVKLEVKNQIALIKLQDALKTILKKTTTEAPLS